MKEKHHIDSERVKEKSFWTRYALWLLVPIILALYFSHDKTVLAQVKQERVVLPTQVKPIHYQLEFTPDLQTFVYNGLAKVDLQVLEKTSVIVLNSVEIVIESASVTIDNSTSYTTTDIQYDTKTDQASLIFNKDLPKGANVALEIRFQGTLNDHMSGFYRSSYKDAHGVTRHLATTQFEATDARRAFPCWDEPALKATFEVTLNVPSDLTALSNMDIISETPSVQSPGLKTVKYATSPRMSTYLLAMVVGPFEYIEANTTGQYNGRPVRTRVYTLPGLVHQGQHALNVATQALEYYAQVFGVPYPLPKLDMVAIPDFDAGAMENWGLVTYRTTALLYDENQSAFVSKRQTAYTVAHELAHQWFGNLVTMEWWDHLWLNEGFATWVGWFAIDNIFPEWHVWTMFATQDMQNALGLDALRSSHPIEVAVNNPSEIHQIFDSISYEKGASVIRMVDSWLTSPVFLSGIHDYLEKHRLGNAATSDLWAALSAESNKNVSEFMNAWVEQPGYPVLNVSMIGKDRIQVTQSRYLLTGDLQDDEDSTIWLVPLQLKAGGKVQQYVLTNKSHTFAVPENTPFKLNQGQTSLYRVNYSKELIQQFINELASPNSGVLDDPSDRAGIISDLGVLSRSGEQSSVTFLTLADALKGESNYFVLTEFSHQLNGIISLYEEFTDIEPRLQKVRRDIFAPIAQSLGWQVSGNEPELNRLLRVLAISEAGLAGDTDVIAEAKKRYAVFVEQKTLEVILPDLRSTVYKIVLKYAANEEEENQRWEEIYSIYNNEAYPMDQRITALTTLGSGIKSERVIDKTLALILDEQNIRTQDAWMTFRSLGANPASRDKLFEFYKSNYDAVYSRFSKSMGSLGNTVSYMVSGFNSFEKIDEIETFFSTKDTSEYSRGLSGAIEKARVNAAQILRERTDIQKWVSITPA